MDFCEKQILDLADNLTEKETGNIRSVIGIMNIIYGMTEEICRRNRKVFCKDCLSPEYSESLEKCPHCRSNLHEDVNTSIDRCLDIIRDYPDFENIGYIYYVLSNFYYAVGKKDDWLKYLDLAAKEKFSCALFYKFKLFNQQNYKKEAQKYLEKALAKKCSSAVYYLLTEKLKNRANEDEIKSLLLEAYELGSIEASYTLANFYLNGKFFEKNIEKGIKLLEKCDKKNFLDASIKLSHIYFFGYENISVDLEKYIYYITKAALLGDSRSQFNLGSYYYKEAKFYEAYIWFKRDAENGNPLAMFFAGQSLLQISEYMGDFVINEALELIKKSADNDCHLAKFELANIYSKGLYGQKDEKEAFEIIKKLADEGYKNAYLQLSEFYSEGLGTPKRPLLAKRYEILAMKD